MTEMSAQELKKDLEERFESKVEETKLDKVEAGKQKNTHHDLWIKTKKEDIKDIISYLKKIQFPHFTTMFGSDQDENIELNYVLTLFYESELSETTVVIKTEVSKEDPKIDSITDLIPGAITTEREMQEMLGIQIKNIPDDRHIYLPFDQPEGEYPWRRDEKGQEIIDIYEKEGQK